MPGRRPLNVEQELLEEFERCGHVTEHLIAGVPGRLWRLPSPAARGRTIGAIVAHIHGVRKTFAKMGGVIVGPSLDRKAVTPAEAGQALGALNGTLATLFRDSLALGEVRVKGLPRRSVNMMIYLIQHDAHHRGQITMRARELGHEFSSDDVMRIWGWKAILRT